MDDFEKLLKLTFLDEAIQMLSSCEQSFLQLENNPQDLNIIDQIFRLAHSFKGSAGVAGFEDLSVFAHHLESLLAKIKKNDRQVTSNTINLLLRANDELNNMVAMLKEDLSQRFDNAALISEIDAHSAASNETLPAPPPPAIAAEVVPDEKDFATGFHEFESTPAKDDSPSLLSTVQAKAKTSKHSPTQTSDENIRVNLERIDHLVNDVGELVILQTVLYEHRHLIPSVLIQKTISQLDKIVRKIQSTSMGLRMVPVKQTFQKMQRIVRDASQMLQKEIRFITSGEDTQIDKTILELLADPLVHLVRNAADHGIELPQDRLVANKPSEGLISLRAYHRGGNIIVEITDDGRGLDPSKLIAKATRLGLIKAGQTLSDAEAYRLIFRSGFSTTEQVTSISGRGVGMDVVKTNVDQIQGQIEIDSTLGQGSCFRILLPLTLAIIDGMIVTCGEQRFVIPIAAITETLSPRQEDIHHVAGHGLFLNVRDETMQLYSLSQILGSKEKPTAFADSIAIVGKNKNGKLFAVLVDTIIGQQQIVIKRLGNELRGLPGITGAAILGDGKAALIVDLTELLSAYAGGGKKTMIRKDAA